MNIKIIMLAGISLIVVLAAITFYNTSAIDKVKVEQMVSGGALLIDVRAPDEFEGGSVPGAINIPLDEIQRRIDEFKDKGNIIVFCRTGNHSNQAITILESNGITTAINGGSWGDVAQFVK